MSKVSVIIPVYKVEAFIERCTRSLMTQTLDDVEYIFVDDASPDRSMDIVRQIISEYPYRDAKIIVHEQNRGLPSARNTGLSIAKGDYIYHCDSDDWLEPVALEKVYYCATENDADFVYCDFYLSFGASERYMRTPNYSSPDDMLRKGFLGGSMKYNVWNKLIKRDIYKDSGVLFPDGYGMGEDMTIIKLSSFAQKISFVHEALYHYVKLNSNAFSNTFSEKHLTDIRYNTDSTVSFLVSRYGEGIVDDIAIFKLGIKLPFLISGGKENYIRWKEWFPETNSFAMKNLSLPFRTRLLQYMAGKGQWWYVRIYQIFLEKIVYGIIYR